MLSCESVEVKISEGATLNLFYIGQPIAFGVTASANTSNQIYLHPSARIVVAYGIKCSIAAI